MRPRRRAATRPALTRSVINALSYSASEPNRLNRNAPCEFVVSIASVSERKATPRTFNSSTIQIGERAIGLTYRASRQPTRRLRAIPRGRSQARPIVARSGSAILMQMTLINPSRDRGGDRAARQPIGAHHYSTPACGHRVRRVRQTSNQGLSTQSHIPTWFVAQKIAILRRQLHPGTVLCGKHMFPVTRHPQNPLTGIIAISAGAPIPHLRSFGI